MLKGISPLVSPELLAVLYRMGHGDEIVLADAHFPGDTYGQRVVRADGLRIANLLDGSLVGLPLYHRLREQFPRTRRDDVYLAISIALTLKEADLMIYEAEAA